MAPITSLYAAIAAIFLVVLSLYVIFQRGKQRVIFGDNGNPVLMRAVRVHGNATEYLPIALIVMLCLELEHGSLLVLHISGILLILGRIAHAIGLARSSGSSVARAFGIIATISSIMIPAIALVFRVMVYSGALWMQH